MDRDASTAAWKAEVRRWDAETRRMPKEDLDAARFVMSEYGSAELTDMFERYGVGHHPAIARLLAKVGRDLQNRR